MVTGRAAPASRPGAANGVIWVGKDQSAQTRQWVAIPPGGDVSILKF